jgi:hypothetical protein
MEQFPSDAHLASWAGLCPGNHESAGIRKTGRTTPGNQMASQRTDSMRLGSIEQEELDVAIVLFAPQPAPWKEAISCGSRPPLTPRYLQCPVALPTLPGARDAFSASLREAIIFRTTVATPTLAVRVGDCDSVGGCSSTVQLPHAKGLYTLAVDDREPSSTSSRLAK